MAEKANDIFWQQSVRDQWELYAPPVRPSKSELAIWEKRLRQRKNSHTLILGATPELRDLCYRLGHAVTLIDVSLPMMQAMQALMRTKNPEEIWMAANWVDSPLRKNYFDFVIGDLVIGNIPSNLHIRFLQEIASVLKPKGLFLHRVFEGHAYSVKEARDATLENARLPLSRQKENELCFGLLQSSWNPKTEENSTLVARKKIRQYLTSLPLKERKREKKYLDRFSVLFRGTKRWWAMPRNTLERTMQKYFRIVARTSGTDHAFVATTPVYILQKR